MGDLFDPILGQTGDVCMVQSCDGMIGLIRISSSKSGHRRSDFVKGLREGTIWHPQNWQLCIFAIAPNAY
jgi:hypothetical protein